MSWLSHELARLAAEADRRHESELEALRHRLQQCETERMQSQLVCLRLEAQVQEQSVQHQELESALHESERELAQQRQLADDKTEERTVEAAQLSRINELSRELIATRFELATALKGRRPSSPAAGSQPAVVAALSLDALLSAASQLDLTAADAILNPSCLLTTSSGGVAGTDPDADDDVDALDEAAAAAPAVDAADGAPAKAATASADGRDALSASLDRALLSVCRPRAPTRAPSPTAATVLSPASPPSAGDALATKPRVSPPAGALRPAVSKRSPSSVSPPTGR